MHLFKTRSNASRGVWLVISLNLVTLFLIKALSCFNFNTLSFFKKFDFGF